MNSSENFVTQVALPSRSVPLLQTCMQSTEVGVPFGPMTCDWRQIWLNHRTKWQNRCAHTLINFKVWEMTEIFDPMHSGVNQSGRFRPWTNTDAMHWQSEHSRFNSWQDRRVTTMRLIKEQLARGGKYKNIGQRSCQYPDPPVLVPDFFPKLHNRRVCLTTSAGQVRLNCKPLYFGICRSRWRMCKAPVVGVSHKDYLYTPAIGATHIDKMFVLVAATD